jgi:hypothetical protein
VATDWPWLILVPVLLLTTLGRLAWAVHALRPRQGSGPACEPARLVFDWLIHESAMGTFGELRSGFLRSLHHAALAKPATRPRCGYSPPASYVSCSHQPSPGAGVFLSPPHVVLGESRGVTGTWKLVKRRDDPPSLSRLGFQCGVYWSLFRPRIGSIV